MPPMFNLLIPSRVQFRHYIYFNGDQAWNTKNKKKKKDSYDS